MICSTLLETTPETDLNKKGIWHMAWRTLTTNLNITHQLLAHPPGLEREFDALLQVFTWSRSATTSWEVLKGRWTNQSWRNGTSTHRQLLTPFGSRNRVLRKPHTTMIKDDNGDGSMQLHACSIFFSQRKIKDVSGGRDSELLEFWYEELRVCVGQHSGKDLQKLFWEGLPALIWLKHEDPKSYLFVNPRSWGWWMIFHGFPSAKLSNFPP